MSDDPQDPTIPMPQPKPKRVRGKGKKKRAPRTERPARAAVEPGEAGGEDLATLRAQIAELNAKLDSERAKRGAAEAAAISAAEAHAFFIPGEIQEIPTGQMVKVKRASGYEVKGYKENGQDILRPIWTVIEIPTYKYRINLPPSGGEDFKINGIAYYHGSDYVFDADTLRTVKEIIHRCWAHDATINGSNENAYRPKQNNRLSARM